MLVDLGEQTVGLSSKGLAVANNRDLVPSRCSDDMIPAEVWRQRIDVLVLNIRQYSQQCGYQACV